VKGEGGPKAAHPDSAKLGQSVARASVTPLDLAREIRAMNERIAKRRADAPRGKAISIFGPRWADRIVDTGELLAIHRDTAEPYPLRYEDLSPIDHAAVVITRVLRTGGTTQEVERLVRCLVLEPYERDRLLRQVTR
jgi:hypothetical protein